MTIHISGAIDVDVLEKIRNHPLRGDRTLSEFYEFIFRDWVNSPHSQEALLQERIYSEVPAQEGSASANGTTLPGTDVLEGDFLAILQAGAKRETESRSYVDLTLRVTEGAAEGAVFTDRILDFPWHPRSDFLRRALAMETGASIIASLPTLPPQAYLAGS